MDARRHRARLCRHDGAGGRGAHRRAARHRQQIRSQGRSADGDRSRPTTRIAVTQAEAAVQQAQASVQNVEAQMAVQQAQISASQAQLDQAQAALVFAQQQADALPDAGERRLGHRSECPAVHVAAAPARGGGADRAGEPQPGAAAGACAEGAAHERRGEPCAGQGPAPAKRR